MAHEMLNKLPPEALELFAAAFQNAVVSGNNADAAYDIAMELVLKSFNIQTGVSVRKHSKVKINIVKHGIVFPNYKFNIDLSNTQWDDDGQRVDDAFLQRMVREGKINTVGDLEHERDYRASLKMDQRALIISDVDTEGLYNLENYFYQNGTISGLVEMNKLHPLYAKYLAEHKAGRFLDASAEYINATIIDGVIMDADEIRFSITNMPANRTLKSMEAVA